MRMFCENCHAIQFSTVPLLLVCAKCVDKMLTGVEFDCCSRVSGAAQHGFGPQRKYSKTMLIKWKDNLHMAKKSTNKLLQGKKW